MPTKKEKRLMKLWKGRGYKYYTVYRPKSFSGVGRKQYYTLFKEKPNIRYLKRAKIRKLKKII